MEIDLGAGNMGVPEKSGQHREVGSWLFTCLVKCRQRSRCEAVARYAACGIMKRIVFAGLGWRLGSNQAHCSRALRIQLIELNRGGAYGV